MLALLVCLIVDPCGVCAVVRLARGWFSRFRLRCKRCISKLARYCPTYAHCARFVCAPCGLLRLSNRRKAPRGWRSGRDPVRGWHCAAWYSLRALVGNSSTGNGCASIDPVKTQPFFFFFYQFSPLYLAISQKLFCHSFYKFRTNRSGFSTYSLGYGQF